MAGHRLAFVNRLRAAVLVSLGAGLVLLATRQAWGASNTVAIASFNYTPADIRVSVGDTVVWTNADPTVHTVTAFRREFSSGPVHQGQKFTAQFNAPGVYPYFCEPHESMRGTVSVTGAAAAPVSTTTTSTTTVAAGVVTTAVVASGGSTTTTTTTSPTAPRRESGGTSVAVAPVASGAVTGGQQPPSPLAASAVAVLAALGGMLFLRRRGVATTDTLRFAAAGCTAVTGALHLQLRVALAYPEPIGTLLVIEAAGAAILTAWVLSAPFTRRVQVSVIAAHVAAVGALAITRTPVGLFGFHELGWDPSPQLPVALTVSTLAIALLGLAKPAVSVEEWPAA